MWFTVQLSLAVWYRDGFFTCFTNSSSSFSDNASDKLVDLCHNFKEYYDLSLCKKTGIPWNLKVLYHRYCHITNEKL